MSSYLSKFFKAAAFLAAVFFMTTGSVNVANAQVDLAKQAAWEAAQADAIGKVSDFDEAVKSGSPEKIRKAGLALQADPIAVQVMNQSRPDLVGEHNQVTEKIKSAAKGNIKDNMASEWNRAHPNDPPITRKDVEIYEPTNYKDPNAKPKSGQDWDVTVRVKGKDVPSTQSQKVVEKSYYDAAGGEKTFGKRAPGVTKEQAAAAAAHKQAVETTHGKSPEAYNQPDVILGSGGKKPDVGKALIDPEQLTHAAANKSYQSRNKAEKATAAGNMTEAATQEFEQMRQASKQYDKITKPRVEVAGGKVNAKVDEGMGVLRDAGAGKISPEQARAKLSQMGETTESIIGKASGQAEAAQKLKALPKEKVSIKSKAMETVGVVSTGIDVVSTAADVKEKLTKDDVQGAVVVVGEAVANQVTGGGYGTVKAIKEKHDDYTGAETDIANANKQNEAAYNWKLEKELRKAGVKPAEVKKLMEAKAKGDDAALENKLKALGIKPPEKIVEKPVEGDDTALQRTVAIGTGMVDNAKKAGKFVKETAEDVTEISTGLLEKGVAAEVVSQTKENIGDGYETYQENKNADMKIADSRASVKARLIAKGATPDGAEKAVEALANGDPSKVRRLNDLLDSKGKKVVAPDPKAAGAGWGSALSNSLESLKTAAAKGGDAVKNAYDKYKVDAVKAEKEKAAAARVAAEAKARDDKKSAEEIEAKLNAEFEFTPEAAPGSPAPKPRVSLPTDGTMAQFLGSWTGKFFISTDKSLLLTLTFSASEPPTQVMEFNKNYPGTVTIDGLAEYIKSYLSGLYGGYYTVSYANAKKTFPCSYGNTAFSVKWTPVVTLTRTRGQGDDVETITDDINFQIWGRVEDDGLFHGDLWANETGKILWEGRRD